MGDPLRSCVVTGACGLVGRRLVEVLAERGIQRIVAFDRQPCPADFVAHPAVEWVVGDLTIYADVESACRGVECVFHIGGLVGPYFKKEAYRAVNYDGTVNVVKACQALGVRKIVMASSPSTRFDGRSFHRVKCEDLPIRPAGQFLVPYAETKAMGEVYCREANDGKNLLTVAVSPHQVYGPRDGLFLASFLQNAARMRIFGNGENEISMVHVDNYCHGLILGERALYPGSPALGKFYVVTDGPPLKIWHALDFAVTSIGYPSILAKMRVPVWLMYSVAWAITMIGSIVKFLPNMREYVEKGKGPFKLNPFAVTMMVIDRSFDISAAEKDLGYKPLKPFKEAWADTLQWYKNNRSFWEQAK